ncbi:CAAX protease self-immunity [Ruminococcaceae bacterium YRB3002]|nr:CAAX protease self-immunity [Ruminococcaceae bacterium YRB3002]
MMLIEQGIFQGGTLFLAVVILVAYSVYMILTTGVETQEFVKTITEGPVVQFVIYLTSAIMQLVAGVVIVVFAARNKDAVRNAPLEGGHLSFGLIMIGLFYILAVNSVVTGYNCLWAFITDSVDYVNPLFAGSYKWPAFLLVSVFPAIVEELLYRGILFRYLRQHGFMYAAVVTGFVFGLIHMNLQQFFFAGTMGFVLCYVYERSGHIWPCMLLHFTNNALATLLEMSDHKADIALLLIWLGFNMFVSLILLVIFDLRGRFRYDSRTVTKTLTATPMLILIIIGICLCLTNVFL